VTGGPTGHYVVASGIHKIKHIIVIEQENRSFDSYFGRTRVPTASPCRTDNLPCAYPFRPVDARRPTTTRPTSMAWPARRAQCEARRQRGKDGRVHHRGHERQKGVRRQRQHCRQPGMLQFCDTRRNGLPHVGGDPELLDYAKDFTLDDHMFEPVASWSLPDHLYLVSGWSAVCSSPAPSSCKNEIRGPYTPAQMQKYVDQAIDTARPMSPTPGPTSLAPPQQARLVGLLRADGEQPDCENDSAVACPPVSQSYLTPASGTRCPSSRMCRRTTRSATSSR